MKTRQQLTRNAIRCLTCGQTIESKHRHHFVTCPCGRVSADGGLAYERRCWSGGKPEDAYEDLSEYVEVEAEAEIICIDGPRKGRVYYFKPSKSQFQINALDFEAAMRGGPAGYIGIIYDIRLMWGTGVYVGMFNRIAR